MSPVSTPTTGKAVRFPRVSGDEPGWARGSVAVE